MNHVYLVWYDNCELYDDSYSNIEAIFSSWDEAVSFIESNDGLKKEIVEIAIFDDSPNHIIVKKPYWNESNDEYHQGVYYIDIWDLDTGKEVPYDGKHILKVIEEH